MTEYDIRNYTEGDWLERLAYTDEWNVRALQALLLMKDMEGVETFMDVGCGRGLLVDFMTRYTGIDARGIDLINPTEFGLDFETRLPFLAGFFDIHDLRDPLTSVLASYGPFDLCISWEVGEHLPPEAADNYCDILAAFTGKWLVFTAAGPNQGGEHHINQQPQSYWRDKLEARGLEYRPHLTGHLRALWGTVNISDGSDFVAVTGPCSWLPHNVQVFRRKE